MRTEAVLAGVGVALIGCGAVLYGATHSWPAPPIPNDMVLVSDYTSTPAVWHDRARHVTCWQIGDAISCLPDWQLTPPEHEE